MRWLTAFVLAGALVTGLDVAAGTSARPACTNASCRACQTSALVASLFGESVYCPADSQPGPSIL
ncbi:MAG: hypothetical protein ACT4QF_00400 [Sporichthyaceae bacterium]